MLKIRMNNQKGFTLVELLIVIVIIGILAGVLISVINPAQQQNRARDAGLTAAVNKVALSTEAFISSYGRVPNDTEFLGSLQNALTTARAGALACNNGNNNVCNFTIRGNPAPQANPAGQTDFLCTAPTFWNNSAAATDNTACDYHYWGGTAAGETTHFRIFVKSFGAKDSVITYDNMAGGIALCTAPTEGITTAQAQDNNHCQ